MASTERKLLDSVDSPTEDPLPEDQSPTGTVSKTTYYGTFDGHLPTIIGYDNEGEVMFDDETERGRKEAIEQYSLSLELKIRRALNFQSAVMEAEVITREMFEEGHIGDMAFRLVISGTPCAAYIDEDRTECGASPRMTVDFDVAGSLEMFPACNPAHAELIKSSVDADLRKSGYHSMPSINGAGRNLTFNIPQSSAATDEAA